LEGGLGNKATTVFLALLCVRLAVNASLVFDVIGSGLKGARYE